ncbi:MAG: trypsin-like peptidase domain-containing protein [Paludibacter sp.]
MKNILTLSRRIFGLLIFVSIQQFVFGQKQEKIFYNEDWKGCSESKASFYRVVTFDNNGKPIGKVKDYYISGELQSEQEGALNIDKENDQNSLFIGKSTGYFKSGNKEFVDLRDDSGQFLLNIHWYENGNKRYEVKYKNGKLDGLYVSYYENGKVKFSSEFNEGKPIDKWYTECDEFESCQKVFFEDFRTKEGENKWEPLDVDDFKSEIIANEGMLMKTKTDRGFAQWIHLPIDISNNFSIESIINFKSGEKNSGQGLIYGFKDWSNYYYYYISANGYYRIGAITDGLNLEFEKWTQSSHINQNIDRNLIKINKVKDKVYFSINGQIVASEDFYSFKGNNIGFFIPSGKKEVLFERLLVRQDIDDNETLSKFSNSTNWKGNGTGFFIDAKGYISTNYHVIENASDIEIDLIQNGQKKSYKAKVISSDKQNDLAIIKIDDKNFKPYSNLPYNFKTKISDIGSNVFALGYPMALSVMGSEVKFTDGKISSKTGYQGDITTYQISVPVQPGNSGGPLFDYDGNIIGVVSAKIMAADNVSYAIKSSYLKNLLDVLSEDINIPNDQTLSSMSLTEKIKLLSDYVVLIKIK